MNRILIANPSMDMVDVIRELLEERLDAGNALAFDYARNRSAAQQALRMEAHRMLITELDLAENKTSSVAREGGLELARQALADFPDLALVIVAPYTTPEISERVAAMSNAALVLQGPDFEDDLVDQVRIGLAASGRVEPRAAHAEGTGTLNPATPILVDRAAEPVSFVIEISLREGGDCDYHAKSEGGRVPFRSDLKFAVKREDLQELVALTAKLVDSPSWAREYEALGDRLRNVLLEGDIEVIKDVARLSDRMSTAKPGSQPKICFIVEKGLYPIALEALRGKESPTMTHYWLQKSLVWRQLAVRTPQFPLFHDPETREGPINCLVVEADTSGMVKQWNDLQFESIPGVKQEADWLVDHLRTQSNVRVGKIGRIWCDGGKVFTSVSAGTRSAPAEACDGSFRDAMSAMLMDDEPWHLVHYAGHSHYDADDDFGYVLLPGRTQAVLHEPDYVGTTDFARWLSRTRFVYMSSCRGSSQDFVFNLCLHGVPALAGFRWNIEDTMAGEHSKTFYENLFKRRSIDDALHQTWNYMFGRYRKNRVWAATQLVMQYAA